MKRILVIDDERALRETLVDILEISGFHTESASDGVIGFKMIQELSADLVICDLNMPNLDGFGLLEKVQKEIAVEHQPPFIFVTAEATSYTLKDAMNRGAADYILKPFDYKTILESISKILF